SCGGASPPAATTATATTSPGKPDISFCVVIWPLSNKQRRIGVMRVRPAEPPLPVRHRTRIPVRHRTRILNTALAATIAAMSLAGCTGSPAAEKRAQPAATQTAAAIAKPPAKPAPSRPFAVGTRTITTKRGDRVLRTTIWYPAKGKAGGAAKRGAKAASGKFPVVVFSHGLNGTPSDYRDLLAAWASAGFV